MGVISLALVAFGIAALGCWRFAVGAVATCEVSDRLRQAAGVAAPAGAPWNCTGADFAVLERLFAASGALSSPSGGAILVSVYYQTVRWMGRVCPSLSPWSEREMTVCSRYLAARIDRFLATNAACSRRVRYL